MPRGLREQFFVELVPDFDQRKKWAVLEKQAKELSSLFKEEMSRQVAVLGSPVAKVFWMGAKSGEDLAPDIVEPARQRIREHVYDNFRVGLHETERGKDRKVNHSFEISKEEVHFSTEGLNVRIPYLGLIRYKKNKHVLSGSDGSRWTMENITSMRLIVRNNYLCLVIDTREDPSLKTKKKPPAKRKSYKWLE